MMIYFFLKVNQNVREKWYKTYFRLHFYQFRFLGRKCLDLFLHSRKWRLFVVGVNKKNLLQIKANNILNVEVVID